MNNKEIVNSLLEELCMANSFTKKEVFDYFSKYVENKTLLLKMVDMGNFYYEYSKVISLIEGTLFQDGIDYLYNIFEQAKTVDAAKVKDAIIGMQVEISEGYANHLINARIHNGNTDERGELEAKRIFEVIGDNVERELKPFLELLLKLIYIIENKEYKTKKLGCIVDELINYNQLLESLFKALFLGISISQWRNISKHNEFKYINENCIKIEYGSKDNRKTDCIQLEQLKIIVLSLDTLKYAFKIINNCWEIDYIDLIAGDKRIKEAKLEKTEGNRSDNLIIQIVETSFAYNLRVEDVEEKDGHVKIIASTLSLIKRKDIKKYSYIMRLIINKDFVVLIEYKGIHGYIIEGVNEEIKIFNGVSFA